MTEAAAARVARATGKALGCRARPRVSKPPMEAAQPGRLIGHWHLVLGTGAGRPTRQSLGVGEGCGRRPCHSSRAPFLRWALQAADNGSHTATSTGPLCCGTAGEPRVVSGVGAPAPGCCAGSRRGRRMCRGPQNVLEAPTRCSAPRQTLPAAAAVPAPVTAPGRAAGLGMAARTGVAPGQGQGCQGQRVRRSSAGTAVAETLCGFRSAFLSHFLHAGQEGCVLVGNGEQGLAPPRCLPWWLRPRRGRAPARMAGGSGEGSAKESITAGISQAPVVGT